MKLLNLLLTGLVGAGLCACSSLTPQQQSALKDLQTVSLISVLDYQSFVRASSEESQQFAHAKTFRKPTTTTPEVVTLAQQSFENNIQQIALWKWQTPQANKTPRFIASTEGNSSMNPQTRQPASTAFSPQTYLQSVGSDALATVRIEYKLRGFGNDSGYGPAVIEADSLMEIVNRQGQTLLTLKSTQHSDESTEMTGGNVIFDHQAQKMFRQVTEKTASYYRGKIEKLLRN